jgi:DNA-binding transcriptional LysR family regulator
MHNISTCSCYLGITMDLKRLRTFVTVVERGSVSKASEQLRITQPALSRQLKDLQEEFDVRLFSLIGRRLVLTSAGEGLLIQCRALLGQADALIDHAQSLRKGDAGVLQIGATPQMIASVFPAFLRQFAKLYPSVQVHPIEAGAIEQLSLLEGGKLHAAISVLQGAEAAFSSHPLPSLSTLAVFSPRLSGIALADPADIRELAGMPLLLLRPSFVTRKLLDAACRLERLVPNIVMESASTDTLLAMAEGGHGVAIVPTSARIVSKALRFSRLTHRHRPLDMDVAVLWDRQRPAPRYAESFADTFAAQMRSLLPASLSEENQRKRESIGQKRGPRQKT